MSIQDVTKPMALDETLQSTNGKMDSVITKLQGIIDALGLDTSVYKAAGNKACAELVSSLLVASNLGNVYNITDSGTTTADFVEGAGKPIRLGDNVAIVDIGTGGQNVFKFDLLSGLVDLSNYVEKEEGKGLSSNDFTDTDKAMIGNIYANNTVLSTDKTPYLNRQCLTPTGFSSYVREKLIGCSVAWNQLVQNGDFADTSIWTANRGTLSASGNKGTFTVIEVVASNGIQQVIGMIQGHKYFAVATLTPSKASVGGFYFGTLVGTANLTANVKNTISIIANCTQTNANFYVYCNRNQDLVVGDTCIYENVNVIDLTLAFGSSVADTLYAMTNNGGIDWLRNHNYPIDQYTQYGYGLYSTKPSAKKVVGFNQWDEEWEAGTLNGLTGVPVSFSNRIRSKNFNRCFGGIDYYARIGFNVDLRVAWYDANYGFISAPTTGTSNIMTSPSNACYFKVTTEGSTYGETYRNDICINISDTNKNGTYEPYSCTTYSLGSTELRGHLIVQNGEIVAEGDVRESNGEVTRYWKLVDLGSLNYDYISNGAFFQTQSPISDIKSSAGVVSAKYTNDVIPASTNSNNLIIGFTTSKYLRIRDTAYTDASTFKTALSGVYAIIEYETPTTETSSPFADPMSLNGCTTEEYVDDRTIPVPVGHETQYMGQSEDVIPIPSMPQSDGVWVQKCYVSGGKAQYVWELET